MVSKAKIAIGVGILVGTLIVVAIVLGALGGTGKLSSDGSSSTSSASSSSSKKAVITLFIPSPLKLSSSEVPMNVSSTNVVTPLTFTTSNSSVAVAKYNTLYLISGGTTVITAHQAAGLGYSIADDVSISVTVANDIMSGRYVLQSNTQGSRNTNQTLPFNELFLWQDNSPANSISYVFTNTNVSAPALEHYGQMYNEYDNFYDIPSSMNVAISGIDFAMGYGDFTGRALKIFGTTSGGTEVLLWQMPDRAPGVVFANIYQSITPTSVTRLRYHAKGNGFPIYARLRGDFNNITMAPLPPRQVYPLKQLFGVNTHVWDWLDPNNAQTVNPLKLSVLSQFKGLIRVYIDWQILMPINQTVGPYFEGSIHGGWAIDSIFRAAHEHGLTAHPCLKTVPNWMKDTYNGNNGADTAELPPKFYADPKGSPSSYDLISQVHFQIAARYGTNKNIADNLIWINPNPIGGWPEAPYTQIRKGLNWTSFTEIDNERDKWWKGEVAFQKGSEFAAMCSAIYDGHKNTMGPGRGVKNADPNFNVMPGGTASMAPDYYRGFVEWSIANRGYKANGQVDLPCDYLVFHNYIGQAAQYQGDSDQGLPLEAVGFSNYDLLYENTARYMNGLPIILNEIGYDYVSPSPFYAPPTATKDNLSVIGDWMIRLMLLYSSRGMAYLSAYQMVDDGAYGQFGSMGLVNGSDFSKRPLTYYMQQTAQIMGDSHFVKYIALNDKNRYVLKFQQNKDLFYVGWMGTMNDSISTFNLPLFNANISIYTLTSGVEHAPSQSVQVSNNMYTMSLTETPIIVKVSLS